MKIRSEKSNHKIRLKSQLQSGILFSLTIIASININIPIINCDQIINNEEFKVGLLIVPGIDEKLQVVFNWTIERLNSRYWDGVKLVSHIETFTNANPHSAQRALCKLLDKGVGAIIGPEDGFCSDHIGSTCRELNIVHFNIRLPGYELFFKQTSSNSIEDRSIILHDRNLSIDLSIPARLLHEAYLDLITNTLHRDTLTYMYNDDANLFQFREAILRRGVERLKFATIKIEPHLEDPRRTFKLLKNADGSNLILLDVGCNRVVDVLKRAQQVNMVTEANVYVIFCADLQNLNLEEFQHGGAIIIWMNEINLLGRDADLMREQAALWAGHSLIPESLTVGSAYVHDSLQCLSASLNILRRIQETRILTDVDDDYDDSYGAIDDAAEDVCHRRQDHAKYNALRDLIFANTNMTGLSGRIQFNSMFERTSVTLNILRLTELGPQVIGNWTRQSSWLDESEKSLIKRAGKSPHQKRDKLKVVSMLIAPFLMRKKHHEFEHGNDRYEGFAIDLMTELATRIGFDFELIEIPRKLSSAIYDGETNDWDEVIARVAGGHADLAVGALSVTSAREEVVDFSFPIMRTGISILFKRPTQKELDFFSFADPFKASVWLSVVAAYLGVSLVLHIVGRLSPAEWVRCEICESRRVETIRMVNEFRWTNSLWFTLSALMQQGCDMKPRSLGSRIIAFNWYFFTLIMVASYTANLASFLSVEKVIYPFERAEDLHENRLNIRYGCLRGGSARSFFARANENSVYKKMLDSMEYLDSLAQAVALVERGNFAFFAEKPIVDYVIERHCNLTQIGLPLDTKGYAIAMPKNASHIDKYRSSISETILSLHEKLKIGLLVDRWWREKGGGMCEARWHQKETFKEFTLTNLGGVFAIVLIGIWLGFVVCAIEIYYNSHVIARKANTTRWAQVKRRLSMALDPSK